MDPATITTPTNQDAARPFEEGDFFGKDKKAFQLMVQPFVKQWPITDGKGKYTDKTTKAEIKAFLMNPAYAITTTMPLRSATASEPLSKSKTPGGRTLTYRKERAVEKAELAGDMKTSALFEELQNNRGITPNVARPASGPASVEVSADTETDASAEVDSSIDTSELTVKANTNTNIHASVNVDVPIDTSKAAVEDNTDTKIHTSAEIDAPVNTSKPASIRVETAIALYGIEAHDNPSSIEDVMDVDDGLRHAKLLLPLGNNMSALEDGLDAADLFLGDSETPQHLNITTEEVVAMAQMAYRDEGYPADMYQDLRVYLTDLRFAVPRKTSAQITVKIVNCGPNNWGVNVRDLLLKLQSSPIAIEGTITLSCPDPFDPEFSLCFLRMVEGTLLEATVPNPGIIFLPIENSLRLTVNHAVENFGYPVIGAKRERSQSLEQSTMQPNVTSFGDSRLPSPPMPPVDVDEAEDDEVKPLLLKQITHTPAGLKLSRGEKSTLKVNAQSAFLATEIAKLPEYADFKKARHSAQSNTAVVQSWQFAAKVDQDYAGSLVGGFDMGPITKTAVQTALGIKSSWMSSAKKGAELVRKYGPGGPHENADVVAELTRNTKDGAKGLFKFFEDKGLN